MASMHEAIQLSCVMLSRCSAQINYRQAIHMKIKQYNTKWGKNIHSSIYLSIYSSSHPAIYPLNYLSIHPSKRPTIYPSIDPSPHPPYRELPPTNTQQQVSHQNPCLLCHPTCQVCINSLPTLGQIFQHLHFFTMKSLGAILASCNYHLVTIATMARGEHITRERGSN